MPSLQGSYLVAPPRLHDDNFFRAVVLLIEHDEEGAIGVILNRPTSDSVDEVMRLLEADDEQGMAFEGTTSEFIYYGGPVPGPLVVLHTTVEYSEKQVLPGIHFSSQKNNLQKVIARDESPYRVYSGYAGWSPGQLEQELERGGWFVVPSGSDTENPDLFAETEQLWHAMSSSLGMDILGDSINPSEIPSDPSVN